MRLHRCELPPSGYSGRRLVHGSIAPQRCLLQLALLKGFVAFLAPCSEQRVSIALFVRAVTLAKREVPELIGVVVEADGSLSGLGVDQLDKDTLADGEVVVVAHMLGLLLTFIGPALMLRLVSDAWPKASLSDIDFDQVRDES
jgi:hypothetical protein